MVRKRVEEIAPDKRRGRGEQRILRRSAGSCMLCKNSPVAEGTTLLILKEKQRQRRNTK